MRPGIFDFKTDFHFVETAMFRDTFKAQLDALVDQACGSMNKGDDDNTRKYVADQLAEATRKGIIHLDELSLVARRACWTYSNRAGSSQRDAIRNQPGAL